MTTVGGGEPKVEGSSLTQAAEVPEAVPQHEPPSFPLTPDDRASVEQDLEDQRSALARHANTEPVAGRLADWSERCWMLAQEVTRLERMLADDDLAIIDQGCMAAVLAGGDTWQQFKTDAERRVGVPWAEIKIRIDERYANRTKATT